MIKIKKMYLTAFMVLILFIAVIGLSTAAKEKIKKAAVLYKGDAEGIRNNDITGNGDLKKETKNKEEKRVIIVYKDKVKDKYLEKLDKKVKDKIKHMHKGIPAITTYADENEIKKIKSDKDVLDVFEDYRVYAFLSDSIPQINAGEAHSAGATGSGKKVCVVDTGIDDSHPALNPLIAETDFVNNDADATDDNGHGTHVAGIIASNDAVYKGVAYGSSLMAAKVLDASGSGWSSDVIAGIDWCVNNGADIISLSLGGGLFLGACDSDPTAQAGNNAAAQGVVVLAATGNDGTLNAISSPACGSDVIAIGAVDDSDGRTPYSNEGSKMDVVAPGGISSNPIISTALGSGFTGKYGTSMATPHASGTAALILQTDPTLTPAQVRDVLRATSVDLGVPGFDTIYGYGRIDAYQAFMAANNGKIVCGSDTVRGDTDNDDAVGYNDYLTIYNIHGNSNNWPLNLCCVDLNNDAQVTYSDTRLAYRAYLGDLDLGSCSGNQSCDVGSSCTTSEGCAGNFDASCSCVDVPNDACPQQVFCNDTSKKGDTDGDGLVTYDDYMDVYSISGGSIPEPANLCCVDLNNDGQITQTDAELTYQVYAGNLELGFCNSNQTCSAGASCTTSEGCSGTYDTNCNCADVPNDACPASPVTCTNGTVKGDTNNDGLVKYSDYITIYNIFTGSTPEPANLCCVDLNNDILVTYTDTTLAYQVYLGTLDLGVCS